MKAFFTAIAANLVTIAICVVGGFVLIIGIIAAAAGSTPVVVKPGSVLVVDLGQSFIDAAAPTSPPTAFDEALAGGENSMSLRSASMALHAAAGDDDISAVFIRGNVNPSGYGSGYAALRELRAAIADFRRSKKPVYAYLVNPDTRDYYVASAASSVTVDPFGSLFLPGLAAEQVFFTGMLEKYGIGIQVSRVGRFKAAVEPFTRRDMSPENREQTRSYLAELWSEVKRGIADSRNVDTTALQTLADAQGIILPNDALAAGLIDRVAYFDVVLADLERAANGNSAVTAGGEAAALPAGTPADTSAVAALPNGDASDDSASTANNTPTVSSSDVFPELAGPTLPQVMLEEYAPIAAARARVFGAKQTVAIVYAEGDIVDGQGSAGTIGGDGLARELRRIRSDNTIKAMVLRINSPGGSAVASEKIQRELELVKRSKPIVVSMSSLAASGGYWIATSSSRIFAQPNTITGSIGVFSLVPNLKGIAAKNGITFDTVKTGRFADIYSLSRPRTEAEMSVLQRGTDAVYDAFIDRVAKARNLSTDSVRALAEGRVWSGTDAMRIGLVDSMGGLDDAVASAVALAEITGDYDIKEYPRPQSATEMLTDMFENTPEPVASLTRGLPIGGRGPVQQLGRDLIRQLGVLLTFDDPRGMYARLPFVLRVR